MTVITISETAARKIKTLMAKQGIDEGGLRVGVKGGGCWPTQYCPQCGEEPTSPAFYVCPDAPKLVPDVSNSGRSRKRGAPA